MHLRAKQLIVQHSWILLPAWTGQREFPNPPTARTATGRLVVGNRVTWPAEIADLQDVRLELSAGQFRPDITAKDEQGERLIEIRVTHAVDDTKAAAVRHAGYRMIEIDLSRVAKATLFDTDSLQLTSPTRTGFWAPTRRES